MCCTDWIRLVPYRLYGGILIWKYIFKLIKTACFLLSMQAVSHTHTPTHTTQHRHTHTHTTHTPHTEHTHTHTPQRERQTHTHTHIYTHTHTHTHTFTTCNRPHINIGASNLCSHVAFVQLLFAKHLDYTKRLVAQTDQANYYPLYISVSKPKVLNHI